MSLTSQQAAHREYAHRPPDERFPTLAALVEQATHEKRLSAERTYNVRDLWFSGQDEAVQLQGPKGVATFTHWAFGQAARVLAAPAAYLRTLPPAITADALNFGLKQLPPATDACLLIKAANGGPTPLIRAWTSDSYGRVWDAELYQAIQSTIVGQDPRWTLPPTWDGQPAGAYRGDRDSFVILVNGGSIVTDPSVGRRGPSGDSSMYRGIMVRNSEVGAASITIEQILFRMICGNHILWGATVAGTFRRRHIGSKVQRDAVREIYTIARAWAQRSADQDEDIIKGLIELEIAHTRDAVIDELRKLDMPKELAEQAYDRCVAQEPGLSPRSYWGIAQGVTRIATDQQYQDERYDLDRMALAVLRRGKVLVAA